LAAFLTEAFLPDRPSINTHSTPLECRNLGIRFSIDIPRRWREEGFAAGVKRALSVREVSLLQRSNMSIDKDR